MSTQTEVKNEEEEHNNSTEEQVQARLKKAGVKSMREAAFDLNDYLENLFNRGYEPIQSGFVDLDSKINGGFLEGQLITLAGRPGMGKSVLSLNVADTVSEKIPSLIFSMEMSQHDIVSRLVTKQTGIQLKSLLTGKLSTTDYARLVNYLPELQEKKLFILDRANISIKYVIEVMKLFHQVYGKALYVIDYLQLLAPDGKKANRTEEVSDMTRKLKNIARELDSPVLMLSQLNREADKRTDKRPTLADLRESGSIEQDSDIVLSVYRDEKYNDDEAVKGIAELGILKNRNGETGIVRLNFSGENMCFRNYAPEYHQDDKKPEQKEKENVKNNNYRRAKNGKI